MNTIPTVELKQLAPSMRNRKTSEVTIYEGNSGFGRGSIVRYEYDGDNDTIVFYNENDVKNVIVTNISDMISDDVTFLVKFTESRFFIIQFPKDSYSGDMPQFMHEGDYIFDGEERCEHVVERLQTLMADAPILNARCVQVKGHHGEHMIASANIVVTVDKYDRSTKGSRDVFGFRYRCSTCRRVDVKNNDSDFVLPGLCFNCSFWTHIYNEKDEHFIIDGHSYAPGKGGFGGRTFHVESADGRTFSGELFTQGEVPSHFRDLLPDDSVFVDKSKQNSHLRLV